MGDAGPPTPTDEQLSPAIQQELGHVREIHVLVTGFGPFKSFNNNPSWLIASALPTELDPLRPSETTAATAQSQPPLPTQHSHRNPLASLLRRTSASTSSTQGPGHPHQRPQPPEEPPQPLRPANSLPYRIHIHTYPSPVRVAYDPTSVLIPSLLNPLTNHPAFPHHPPGRPGISFDFVLHIGLASGRDSYTLETIAHRDNYLIPDVDDQTGYLAGEKIWKGLRVPERLDVGWHPTDVLRRWTIEVGRRQDVDEELQAQLVQSQTSPVGEQAAPSRAHSGGIREYIPSTGILGLRGASLSHHSSTAPVKRRAVVKLSRDAGRYLCEFIFMCSLVYRHLEHQEPLNPAEKLGKVVFLHVPNGTDEPDIARGVMVAESAIRSVVASWEDGWRNPQVYSQIAIPADAAQGDIPTKEVRDSRAGVGVGVGVGASEDGFESKGTGDA